MNFHILKASLLDIPGVLAVHDLHVWSLTVGTTAIAVHLVIGEFYGNVPSFWSNKSGLANYFFLESVEIIHPSALYSVPVGVSSYE